MTPSRRLSLVVLTAFVVACSPSSTGSGDAGLPGDAGAIEQLPPEGDEAMQGWLADEHYLDWTCQPSPGPGAPGSHGRRRICHNDALANALAGRPLPRGSAVVKELYDDNDQRTGTAVITKVGDDGASGASWYFYERVSGFVTADGRDQVACTVCHAGAENDGGREMIFVDVE